MYTLNEIVTTSRVDQDGHLSLFGAVQLMQDCSELWSESNTHVINYFDQCNRAAWLAFRQIEVHRVPSYRERLTITSGLFECKELYALRNTIIRDSHNQVCYAAWSMGAFVDSTTGRLSAIPSEICQSIHFDNRFPMSYRDRRIRIPDAEPTDSMTYTVCRNDIDYNRHLNSAHYVRLAVELLPVGFEPRNIRIDYKQSLHLNDQAHLQLLPIEGGYLVVINGPQGRCCILEFLA